MGKIFRKPLLASSLRLSKSRDLREVKKKTLLSLAVKRNLCPSESARDLDESIPTVVVDAYPTLIGIDTLIHVAHEKKRTFGGVGLASGDLAYLGQEARRKLTSARLSETHIFPRNRLGEHLIASLQFQKAPFDSSEVETLLAAGGTQTALQEVYKRLTLCENTGWIPITIIIMLPRLPQHQG